MAWTLFISSLSAQTVMDGPLQRQIFTKEVKSLIEKKSYAELDALEERIRTKKERFTEGLWKLFFFTEAFEPTNEGDEAAWTSVFKLLEDWKSKNPASIAVPVVHAKMLVYYAWKARGSGYANTVKEESWALFRGRLEQARAMLEKATDARVLSPEWHYVMLKVALGQGWDQDEYFRAFDEATAHEPEYENLYFATATYLLPRWHGTEGEWEAFVYHQMEKLGSPYGNIIYARIAWSMTSYYKDIYKQTKIKWTLVKAGFEEMLKQYPKSEWNLQNYCKYAVWAGDKVTAKELFKQMGDPMVVDVWGNIGYLKRCQQWASEP